MLFKSRIIYRLTSETRIRLFANYFFGSLVLVALMGVMYAGTIMLAAVMGAI